MSPTPLIVRAYLARGFRLWVVLRAAATAVLVATPGGSPKLSAEMVIILTALCVSAGLLDTRAHGESALLANLGIELPIIGVFFAVPALLGEVALHFAMAAIA